MSTRANVIIKDKFDKLIFYRHSDGYPEGALPTLEKFMRAVKEGKIRDNVGQAAGWLILFGAKEYETVYSFATGTGKERKKTMKELFEPGDPDSISGWKCGAYEPTTGRHGDIEYAYVLDLTNCTIGVYETSWIDDEKTECPESADWLCKKDSLIKIIDMKKDAP